VKRGVIDVTLSKTLSSYPDDDDVRNEVLDLIPTDRTAVHDDYTFKVLVFPNSIKPYLSGARAWIPGETSWYRDAYGSDPTYLIHEVSHNLGQSHSGYKADEYGDPTCQMGVSYIGRSCQLLLSIVSSPPSRTDLISLLIVLHRRLIIPMVVTTILAKCVSMRQR